MTTSRVLERCAERAEHAGRPVDGGACIEAVGLVLARHGVPILDDVSLTIPSGSMVAVVGPSGAGKSTLLRALAGLQRTDAGHVRYDGVEIGADAGRRHALGYVPQDDIIHRDLPLRATLLHAARLRLPASTTGAEATRTVDEILAVVGLTEQAPVRVRDLSGGQRKRASIAVELLAAPQVCFLDEPTSGLDPHTATRLAQTLRDLADRGCTVVATTHRLQDAAAADVVVVLGPGGVLRHVGPPGGLAAAFDVTTPDDVFGALHDRPAERPARVAPTRPRSPRGARRSPAPPQPDRPTPGAVAEWRALARRDVAVAVANRATTAVVLGGPVMVVAMFAVLFSPGAFGGPSASPTGALMVAYWLAFSAFFFGVTNGLLQICTELAVVRRERHVGLRVGPYLAAKLTVLVPALAVVDVVVVGVLRALDILPATGLADLGVLTTTLLLDAVAAAALGLLASAVVADAVQAALALPVLCFPAVLFSGGVLSVARMTATGEAISVVVPDRWAFEAVGRTLGLDGRFPDAEVVAADDGAFTGGVGGAWIAMLAVTAAALLAAHLVLARRLDHP